MDANLITTAADLVILPGLMCDSRMFGATLAEIGGSRVIDGFYGRASSLEDMAAYTLERIPNRVSLLGHSMGARVALELLRMAPERVERLALADTGVHSVRSGEAASRYSLSELGRKNGMEALVDAWLPPMLGNAARNDPHICEMLRDMCIDAGLASYEAQIDALLSRPEVCSLLPQISCPTILMVGREDEWSPPAQHEQIAKSIPGAQFRIVDGAGHMLPTEKPAEFNQIVREWLALPAYC